MPLTALLADDGRVVDVTVLGVEDWVLLHPKSGAQPLKSCTACRHALSAVERLGTRFFRHLPGAPSNCPSAGETAEHRALKALVAGFVRAAGWQAEPEKSAEVSDLGTWRADVLASSSLGRRVAFEIQLSPMTIDVAIERTNRYERDGVEVVWLAVGGFRPWEGKVPSVHVWLEGPMVVDGLVVLGDSSLSRSPCGLGEFVVRVLSGSAEAVRVDSLAWPDGSMMEYESQFVEWMGDGKFAAHHFAHRWPTGGYVWHDPVSTSAQLVVFKDLYAVALEHDAGVAAAKLAREAEALLRKDAAARLEAERSARALKWLREAGVQAGALTRLEVFYGAEKSKIPESAVPHGNGGFMVWVHDGVRLRAWALVNPKEYWSESKQSGWWSEVRVWLPQERSESTEDKPKYKSYGRVIGPWLTKSEDHAIGRLPALKSPDEIWAGRRVSQRLETGRSGVLPDRSIERNRAYLAQMKSSGGYVTMDEFWKLLPEAATVGRMGPGSEMALVRMLEDVERRQANGNMYPDLANTALMWCADVAENGLDAAGLW
jgi:hypothetical protein